MTLHRLAPLSLACLAALLAATGAQADEPASLLASTARSIPAPPWAAGDQKGMANGIGPGTWARCAWHLARPGAKVYEASWERTNTMPKSPFTGPLMTKPKPVASIPGTMHAFNGETLNDGAEPGQQGTQIDALGHFGVLKSPWDPAKPVNPEDVTYYGGQPGRDVKPTSESPLLKLGIDAIPPIVTTAIVLDAKKHVGGGQALKAGDAITARQIDAMLKAQGLAKRGIQPGDVVYIYTGWSDHYQDPDVDKKYYSMAPGLAYDAAMLIGSKRAAAIGLDAPFIDAVADGMLAGKAGPAPGAPQGLPFSAHHHFLTQAGVLQIENARLHELVRDQVNTGCTMVLPTREKGAAGAAVRPVVIGRGRAG